MTKKPQKMIKICIFVGIKLFLNLHFELLVSEHPTAIFQGFFQNPEQNASLTQQNPEY